MKLGMQVMQLKGNLDAIIFNPIASACLKWMRFKVVKRMHYLHHSALPSSGLGLFSIVGFPWLHHMLSSAYVIMEPKHVLYCRAKQHRGSDVNIETRTCNLL
jgi:hypothetical protein